MPTAQQSLAYPELSQLLGDRYTESPFERSFYRRDLAAVPPFLASLVGRTLPAAVARPRTADEVAAILRYAGDRGLAVTPRAAATTAYWNAVPLRGGLALDLNGMRGLIGLDEERLTATVLPATRWEELDRALMRRGFTLLSYPTSAPAATVGGWISMEGYGIGSLKHGGVAGQVVELEVVLADGSIVHASGSPPQPMKTPAGLEPLGGFSRNVVNRLKPRVQIVGRRLSFPGQVPEAPGPWPVSLFAATEGTLGIITRVELAIRRRPEAIGHHLLRFEDMGSLAGAALELAAAPIRPFYAHFAAPSYGELLRRAGFAASGDGPILALTYDGDPDQVAAGAEEVRAAAQRYRGAPLPDELAEREWHERFAALRLKRAGPSVLGAESWLPLERLGGYVSHVEALARAQGLLIATYGTVVAQGLATVMSLYPCDESRLLPYVLALSLTKKLYDVSFRHAGRPYGTGVWNTPYLAQAFAQEELDQRRAWKCRLDPHGILNPGKVYGPPPLLQPAVFKPGMEALALARRAARRLL